jgi:hypothetical protein
LVRPFLLVDGEGIHPFKVPLVVSLMDPIPEPLRYNDCFFSAAENSTTELSSVEV